MSVYLLDLLEKNRIGGGGGGLGGMLVEIDPWRIIIGKMRISLYTIPNYSQMR